MRAERIRERQQVALKRHCRLACECGHPRYAFQWPESLMPVSIVLTVNSGYECLEQGYGGAVWHSSAAGLNRYPLSRETLEKCAREALEGVGDTSREWEEWTGRAFHLRRRLTPEEEQHTGPAIDVRGTPEYDRRIANMRRMLPAEIFAAIGEE